MYKFLFDDNLNVEFFEQVDLIYADMVYENLDFLWVTKYWDILRIGGIFIVQTDHHSVFEIAPFIKRKIDAYFVNHCVVKNEWGNHPKDRFHQCFDDILIFSKGTNYKFYPERVQVPKVTLTKKLNPSGRTTKQATAWIDDCTLTTTSKERVKKADGHLVRWQKPLKLFDRIIAPFTDEYDIVVDPFMGSGSLAEWCKKNIRQYVGIENDPEVYGLALARISQNESLETP